MKMQNIKGIENSMSNRWNREKRIDIAFKSIKEKILKNVQCLLEQYLEERLFQYENLCDHVD